MTEANWKDGVGNPLKALYFKRSEIILIKELLDVAMRRATEQGEGYVGELKVLAELHNDMSLVLKDEL